MEHEGKRRRVEAAGWSLSTSDTVGSSLDATLDLTSGSASTSNGNSASLSSPPSSTPSSPAKRRGELFAGIHICLLRDSCESKRHAKLRKQRVVQQHGRLSYRGPSASTTHVLCGDASDVNEATLRAQDPTFPPTAVFARVSWLTHCLQKKRLVSVEPYKIPREAPKKKTAARPEAAARAGGARGAAMAAVDAEGLDTAGEAVEIMAPVPFPTLDQIQVTYEHGYRCYNCGDRRHGARECPRPLRGTPGNDYVPFHAIISPASNMQAWVCGRPHPLGGSNQNEHLTDVLAKLLAQTRQQERGKATYFKLRQLETTIAAIKKHPRRITRMDDLPEAVKGKKTLGKIEEILTTGSLERTEHLDSAASRTAQLFMQIWGVGREKADKLVLRGYTTLEHLEDHLDELNPSQQVGLRFFDDFQQRIPREEVSRVETYIRKCASRVCPGSIAMVCGSYRRGKRNCGDVDVVLSHSDGRSHKRIFKPLLELMAAEGFLTHRLTTSHFEKEGTQEKYMGVYKFADVKFHRRLDVIVCPWEEWAPAILYFCGSGVFNRSMRLLARKNHWSLSQHTLSINVTRDRHDPEKKTHDGTPVLMLTEHDIFAVLGIPYQPPHLRNA